ncbi:hypothetical protein K7J14_02730 [Treponema zuelzerae]|uniref:Uncharacterized protein n=1 Tax=Teretinema zuelzerae TaxID=156 RepID=A0AAE3EGW6_9SPIR|nr:hypothetical protein [Teretinema zuelzerae]MCD1653613.1 hypothetical protein [Teretinema zuelzerae]
MVSVIDPFAKVVNLFHDAVSGNKQSSVLMTDLTKEATKAVVNDVSDSLDNISNDFSTSKYLAEDKGMLNSKAVGYEVTTNINVLKGNLYISGKVVGGADLKLSIPKTPVDASASTFVAEGVFGIKDGALIVKAKASAVQVGGQFKDYGVNAKIFGFVGVGAGFEVGPKTLKVEGAPAGAGLGVKFAFDWNSIFERAMK